MGAMETVVRKEYCWLKKEIEIMIKLTLILFVFVAIVVIWAVYDEVTYWRNKRK